MKCRTTGMLRAGARMVLESRGFPEALPERNIGECIKLGCSVHIHGLRGTDQGLNGQFGTCVGCENDGTWDSQYLVRLWDGDVVTLRKDNVTRSSLKLEASMVVELTQMDVQWVRLKDLKARPELNGKDGLLESSSDGDTGRFSVRLHDGSSVKVKPDNVEVVELERPEFQGSVGLLDTPDPAQGCYKVLVVRQGQEGRVQLQTLTQNPLMNGKRGVLVGGIDENTEKYSVKLDHSGGRIKIRKENLLFEGSRLLAKVLRVPPQCVSRLP